MEEEDKASANKGVLMFGRPAAPAKFGTPCGRLKISGFALCSGLLSIVKHARRVEGVDGPLPKF